MIILQLQEIRQTQSNNGIISDFTKHFTLLEVKEVENKDGFITLDFTISDGSVDRDYDVINVDGWELENYRKNPVVLWAHDAKMPPIAKSLTEFVEDGKLKSRAQFVPREISAFGHSVARMYQEGFLKAVSVGLSAKEWKFVEDKDRPYGIDFIRQELLEYSCVPIPANPQALIDGAKSKNIDIEPLYKWASEILEAHKDSGFLMPVKEFYEQAKPISVSFYQQKNNLLKMKGVTNR